MAKSINKTVEEKVVAEIESLIQKINEANEALIKASKSGKTFSNSITAPPATYDQLNKELAEAQKIISQLQKEQKSYGSTLASLKSKVEALIAAKKGGNAVDRQIIIDRREQRKLDDAEAISNSNLTTFIQKLSVTRKQHSDIVADLNAKKQLGIVLSEKEQQQLIENTAAFVKYDAAIKAGKQSIGDAREYVGQYERANWGLNNSINQITRELPAFTFNAQTGFLAISNNIPILVDEINRLKTANKELIAQGQPIKSVLGQIAGAFLSWNTVISLGITLVTVYGKEIGNLVKSLFNLNTELTDLEKNQKKLSLSMVEGRKNAIQEKTELVALTRIAKDKRISDEERNAALEKIRGTYYFYFKQLSDGEILEGKTAKAVRSTTQALEARERANIIKTITDENKAKIIGLELEFKQSKLNENYLQHQKDKERINPQILELTRQNAKWEEEMIRLRLISQGLDVKENQDAEKNTQANKERFRAEEDYLKSDYELRKRRLEVVRDMADEITQDEERAYEDRLNAQSVFYDASIKLAEIAQVEEKRILEFETKNELAELAFRLNKEELSQKDYAKAVEGIKYDSANKQKLIELNYLEAINQANVSTVEKLKGLWNELTLQKNINAIDAQELRELQELEKILNSIDFSILAPNEASVQKVENAMSRINELLQESSDEAQKLRLEEQEANLLTQINDLVLQGEYGEKKLQLENELTQNRKEQAQLRIDIAREETEKEKQAFEEMVRFKKEMSNQLYQSLKELGNQLFENTINRYDREIEKSNQYYDTLIENSEKGSEQEKRLIEEKEKAEEDLRKRQVQAQRRQAIFNKILAVGEIAVETAKNITKAFPNPVLMALAAGLGVAQTAVVLATPLPQYKDGRKGGPAEKAVVGDGYVNEFIEKPDGRIYITPNKPTLVDLGAGDIVHKDTNELMQSKPAIMRASIMASLTNQSNQLKAFDYYLGKELKGLPDKVEKSIEKGFKKAKNQIYVKMPDIDIEHFNYRNRGFNA